MKSRAILLAAIYAATACGLTATAQVVGTEDFESYPLGAWTNAPDANPSTGGAGTEGTITNFYGADQELLVSGNLQGNYGVNFQFNVPMTGNVSRNVDDYQLEFFLQVDPAALASYTNTGVGVTIYNPEESAQGTEISLGSVSNYGDAVTNGAVLTIPLAGSSGLTYVPWDREVPLDGSAPSWRLNFGSGLGGSQGAVDQPVGFVIDDVVVTYIEPLMVNPEGTPVGYQTTNDLTITGTVYDGAAQVDTMELYLDGAMVATTSNNAGGSITNMVSYDAFGLSSGTHIASVMGYDTTGTNSVSHEWSFYVAGDPTPPATIIQGLYNINFAHSSHGNSQGLFPVDDGLVLSAPSTGSNAWANIDYPNIWWLGDWTPKSIPEASGEAILGDIHLESVYAGMQMYSYYTWGPSSWATTYYGEIWASAMGGANCNMDFELRNLDTGFTYDLYLYFTDPVTANMTTTTYSLVKGYAPSMSTVLLSEQAAVNSGGVTDANYTTITEITPDPNGVIRINVAGGSNGGGLSALQLAIRLPVATLVPTVQSMSVSGGTVELTFDAQNHINYAVLGKENLTDPTWGTVTNGIPGGNGGTKTVIFPANPNSEFYKVQSE